MKVPVETLKGYEPTTDAGVAETQFENFVDSFRHKDDPIAIADITDLAEAIADPAKFQAYLEALADGGALGVVLTLTDEGIAFAPLTVPLTAIAAGVGMRITGEGVEGSPYHIHNRVVSAVYTVDAEVGTAIEVPHGLSNVTPDSFVSVFARSESAAGFTHATIDDTKVSIHYPEPTPDDQGSFIYSISIEQIFA